MVESTNGISLLPQRDRSYSLDVLKIFATIMIVMHHYQQLTNVWYEGGLNFFNGKFYFGFLVELFFMLSGFFMNSYIEKIKAGLSFKQFYLKRALRVIPMLTISAVTYEIVMHFYKVVFGSSVGLTFWGTALAALGLQDGWAFVSYQINNPTWYIDNLLLCYCVFYLLTYISGKLKISSRYIYLIMVFIGCAATVRQTDWPFLTGDTSRGYYAFFAGVLLSTYLVKRRIGHRTAIGAAVLAASLIFLIVFFTDFMAEGINFIVTFLLYPALIVLFSSDEFKRMFHSTFWQKWAEVSFNVYIWHAVLLTAILVIVQRYAIIVDFASIPSAIEFIVVAELFGLLSYFLLEKPIQKVLDRHLAKLQKFPSK